jgi:uncharacterized protein
MSLFFHLQKNTKYKGWLDTRGKTWLDICMAVTFNLLDIPPGGLQIHHEVEPSALSLSRDEGTVIGNLSCSGNLLLTDERTAHFLGTISGRVSRECVRCLAVFEESLSLPCEAEFRKPSNALLSNIAKSKDVKGNDVLLNEDHPEEDVYVISGNEIDLLPVIREHVILATPLQPLCKEDCLGLCQVCGANLNEGQCGCRPPDVGLSPVRMLKQTLSRQN